MPPSPPAPPQTWRHKAALRQPRPRSRLPRPSGWAAGCGGSARSATKTLDILLIRRSYKKLSRCSPHFRALRVNIIFIMLTTPNRQQNPPHNHPLLCLALTRSRQVSLREKGKLDTSGDSTSPTQRERESPSRFTLQHFIEAQGQDRPGHPTQEGYWSRRNSETSYCAPALHARTHHSRFCQQTLLKPSHISRLAS